MTQMADLEDRLGAKVMVAMANRSPLVLAEGQARIERGEYVDEVFAEIEDAGMVFRWAGFVVLTLAPGSLGDDKSDA